MVYRKQSRDEIDVTKWAVIVVLAIVVIFGAIELNARRQAAAFTRELLRPATPTEQAQLDAQLRELEKSMAISPEEEAAMRGALWSNPAPSRPRAAQSNQPAPLAADERCINRQRFRRVTNGWEQVGTC